MGGGFPLRTPRILRRSEERERERERERKRKSLLFWVVFSAAFSKSKEKKIRVRGRFYQGVVFAKGCNLLLQQFTYGIVSDGGFAESLRKFCGKLAEICPKKYVLLCQGRVRKFCGKSAEILSTSDFQSEVGEVFGEIGGELPAKFGRRFLSFFCWRKSSEAFSTKTPP